MRGQPEAMPQQTPQLEVSHLTGFGKGVVAPTETFADDEVAREVAKTQEPVQDPAIVCIDERHAADASEAVRRKTAGGGAMSGFEAAVLADWYLLPAVSTQTDIQPTANDVFDFVATEMDKRGIKLGAHTDNHAHGQATNCGAMDGAPAGNERLADIGTAELQPIVAAVMGDDFKPAMFDKIVERARLLKEQGFFSDWNSVQAQEKVRSLGGVVEVLDGEDVLVEGDTDNARHGHGAEAIVHNTNPSKSNNRDATNIRYFQLDKSAVDEIANVLGRNEHETDLMRHAIYAYNVSIAYGLTADQRFIQV